MFKRLLGFALAFGMAATAPPAVAASCGMRDALVEQLTKKYSETLTVGGLQKVNGAQSVMEIWSSSETGTYTVLLTQANGTSCIIAAGTDFFEAVPKVTVEGTSS